ncbi:MAG: hypothetical protein HOE90_24765 [Bacteriovoracaceae bacterium]|jgi:hypothetical protein|nr:hypothetical protein [Bacteriovoracaceae bacterium]
MDKSKDWKNKVQGLLSVCQTEIKKTTAIGKKMVGATMTSSNLHESYEELGKLVFNSLKSGELSWDNQASKELIEKIDCFENDLKKFEMDVKTIKSEEVPKEKTDIKT